MEAVLTTTIGLFGAVHQDEMQQKFGWDDGKTMALFDRFCPDVVCGEVRRSDYESGADYQGPSEYRRFIFRYCVERYVPFVPCDFFRDEDVELARRPLTVPDEEAETAEKEWNAIMEEFFRIGGNSKPPFNSPQFNALAKRKQEFQYKYAPEAAEIIWNRRNRAIAENIKAAAAEHRGAKVLVVFGAEHIYWLAEALEGLEGVSIRFPL